MRAGILADAILFERALDELDDPFIVWQPASGDVSYANRCARDRFVDRGGRVVALVCDAARAHRDARRQSHGETPPPRVIDLCGCRWYVRTATLDDERESIFGRRGLMREIDLLRRFQQRYRLADRKLDVLRCILRGRPSSEIASTLRIAQATVRRHVNELLDTLGLKSKFELFQLADAIRNAEP